MFNEDEEWRHISGYPDYLISDLGRVWNVRREHFMTTRVSNTGYERVGLWDGSRQRSFSVHRLVAEAFLFRPPGTYQVNHIDGDKLYNVVENLEWTTQSENMRHADRLGLRPPPSNRRAVRIIETDDVFSSINECSRAIGGISQGVHNCLSGQFHTYMGFTFEYVNLEGGER